MTGGISREQEYSKQFFVHFHHVLLDILFRMTPKNGLHIAVSNKSCV